jgi:hypothetical protein
MTTRSISGSARASVEVGDDLHAGMVGQDLGGVAGDHGVQRQARRGGDQRRVEGLADEAIADQGDLEGRGEDMVGSYSPLPTRGKGHAR